MRTLAITQNVTVDGSIEMLDDWFDAQGQGDQSDLLEELHRQDSRSDALLTGRQTFTDLRGYWPTLTDDTTGVTDYLNQVHKYVVSSTMTDPQWQNTTVLSGDPVDAVRALKAEPGQDIVVTGSITLCHTLIEAGLVDEYTAVPLSGGPGARPETVRGRLRSAPAAADGRQGLPRRARLHRLRRRVSGSWRSGP